MSSADRRRAALAGLLVALAATTAGCGAGAEEPAAAATPSATPADVTTRALAAVEHERQCTVAAQSFADETAITTDLEDRLDAAGLTYRQWKDWHDALVDSPALVDQFAEVGAAGCPAA